MEALIIFAVALSPLVAMWTWEAVDEFRFRRG